TARPTSPPSTRTASSTSGTARAATTSPPPSETAPAGTPTFPADASVEDVGVQGAQHRVRTVARPELEQHGRDVVLDRALRQEQRLRDLAVAVALRDEPEHFQFALGELLDHRQVGLPGRPAAVDR